MSDVSKVLANGVLYDIEDTIARKLSNIVEISESPSSDIVKILVSPNAQTLNLVTEDEVEGLVDKYFSKEAVESVVREWLDEHPEATTTVEDGSITYNKLETGLKNDAKSIVDISYSTGAILNPVYMGEWVLSYQYVPSSFVKMGNTLYLMNFNRYGDMGKLITVDLSQNLVINTENKYLRHCNSAAYVPSREAIYIAPSQKSSSTGEITPAYGIIKYDANFSSYTEIATGSVWLAVSYDEVTGKVYAYKYNGELYEIVDDVEFNLIGAIQIPDISRYNQDMAVRNGHVYLSGYNHYYLHTRVDDLNDVTYGSLLRQDQFGKYIFDENESWEFVDGELYCVEYSKHREVQSFGFFVKMSTRFNPALPPSNTTLAGSNFTAFINDADKNKFTLPENRFLHPNQLNTCLKRFETLCIDNTTNYGNVYLADNLVINKNFVCNTLELRADAVYFDPTATNTVSIGTINIVHRGAKLTFGGPSGFIYTIDSIVFGYSLSQVNIKRNITITPYVFGTLALATPLTQPIIVLGDQAVIAAPIFINKTNQNITVQPGQIVTKTYTWTAPWKGTWRGVFEYADGALVGSVGRAANGNTLTLYVYIRNFTDTAYTVDNFRIIMLCDNNVG